MKTLGQMIVDSLVKAGSVESVNHDGSEFIMVHNKQLEAAFAQEMHHMAMERFNSREFLIELDKVLYVCGQVSTSRDQFVKSAALQFSSMILGITFNQKQQ